MPTHRLLRYSHVLWIGFVILWIALAIRPYDRADWALENALVALLLIVRVVGGERLALSSRASALLCIFLALHTVGSHYTYSKVPYDAWLESLASTTLSELFGWERNHYDRLVHFSAGVLLLPALAELWAKRNPKDEFGAEFVALLWVMAGSLLYELIEWGAAVVFGGELGAAYLGTQGDSWDAQKDMALASAGGLLMLTILVLKRHFSSPKSRLDSESGSHERSARAR